MSRMILGIDLGGTNLRGVLSDEDGNFLATFCVKAEFSSREALLRQMVTEALSLCKSCGVGLSDITGVGVASTGPLDMERGRLFHPTNIPFSEVSIVGPLKKRLGLPVYLINDCNAAALGEKMFGAGKRHDNLVYVTIGTGIGAGAIVDGHLLLGKDGNAAEVGHFVVDPNGRLMCGCGKRGHWEAYCSGKNIPNYVSLRAQESGVPFEKMDTPEIFRAAETGDKFLRGLIDEIGRFNAIGVADIVNAYDPSLVTMGGSVVLRDEELVVGPVVKGVKEFTRNRTPRIRVTPLGENVGLYGAVATVLMHEEIFGK